MTDSPSPQEENEILGMDTDSGPSAGHYCSLYNGTIGQLEATLENNEQLQEQLKAEKSSANITSCFVYYAHYGLEAWPATRTLMVIEYCTDS